MDLNSRAEAAKKDVEAEKKKFEGFKKDLDSVAPQTGEIKYAQKRYFESEEKIQKLEQTAKFYEIRAASRKRYTKLEYLKAFHEGKEWPTPEEIEAYKVYKLASSTPKGWDSRKRVSAYEQENGIAPSGSKEPPKKEKAASGGGGH